MKPLQKYIFKYFFADEVFKKCFEPFLDRYEIGLETSMKGNDWIYDYVNLLYYKCHKINLKGKSILRIWSHLLKKSLMENFISCAVVRYKTHKITIFMNHSKITWKLLGVSSNIMYLFTFSRVKISKSLLNHFLKDINLS